ncbi:hypothetical protein J4H86_01605 [Spiractinospora alimapuensis]|nr:hypothetical protein J4H86_01605 [Spiractinospora alimapuensis]
MFVVHVGLGWTLASGENALYGVVAGRAAALFAVLAGVSMALLSGGSRPKRGDAERGVALWRIVLRGLLILPVGVGLALLGTGVSVILAYYAVFFVLAVVFLAERWRVVALTAVVLGVVGPVVSFFVRRAVEGEGPAASVVGVVNGFDPLERVSGEGVVDLLLTGAYPALTWLPFVLVGLALGRLDLWSTRVRWWLVGVGVGVATVAYAVSWFVLRQGAVLERLAASENPETGAEFGAAGVAQALYEGFSGTVPVSEWMWLLVAAPHSGTPFEVFGAGGIAVALLGVCLLVGPYLRGVGYPLAAVGACALTVYVGHIVVIWVTDNGWLSGTPLWWAQAEVAWTVLLGSLVFATVWRLLVGRGPLEGPLSVASSWAARRIP